MKKSTRIIAGLSTLALTAGLAQAVTNTATMAGFLNDSATWGGTATPTALDSNVWASSTFKLTAATTPEDFWGGMLRLDPVGKLRPANSGIVNLKGDLHMNGGIIDGGSLGLSRIRLPNQVLILDAGLIQTGNSATKDLLIEGGNATASGSGTIRVTGTGNKTSQADINIDMTGFSGLFYLENSGILGLGQDIATNQASFGIRVRSGQNNKYLNKANMALTSLQLTGVLIEDGTYTYADFHPLLQNYLGDTTNTITVLNPPEVSVSSIVNGNIFSNDTWGVDVPVLGDTQTWRSSTNNLEATNNENEFFHGQQLVLESGGLFTPGLNGVSRFNALELDGGVLAYNRNSTGTIQADALILNSGTIKSGNSTGRNLNISGGGVLWGDGTISILGNTTASNHTETGFVNFNFPKMSGFTGTLDVKNYGTLKLQTIATNNASFSLKVTGTGRYQNQFDAAFTTVTLGDTPLPIGEYDEAYFIANDLTNFLVQTTGIITVTGKSAEDSTYAAWAIDKGLTNGINAMDYDVEPDGMDNLLEYALDGNPLADDAATVLPMSSIVDVTGTSMIEYVYNRRIDYALRDMDYGVLLGTDLVNAPPTNNVGDTYETGAEATDTEFESVTNQIPTTETVKFISLEVIQN